VISLAVKVKIDVYARSFPYRNRLGPRLPIGCTRAKPAHLSTHA
jgi:hypothetical protein